MPQKKTQQKAQKSRKTRKCDKPRKSNKDLATSGKLEKSNKKPSKPNKKAPDKSTLFKLKAGFCIILGISLVIFGAVLVLLRSSIQQISQDPNLSTLTNDATFKIVQIINRNKNLYEDDLKNCWNMKNPFDGCHEENKITRGNYVISGGKSGTHLEGPYMGILESDIFRLSENLVRDMLGGFKRTNVTYYQIVSIDYPKTNLMQVEVKTTTSEGDKSSQTITIKGYPIMPITPNE